MKLSKSVTQTSKRVLLPLFTLSFLVSCGINQDELKPVKSTSSEGTFSGSELTPDQIKAEQEQIIKALNDDSLNLFNRRSNNDECNARSIKKANKTLKGVPNNILESSCKEAQALAAEYEGSSLGLTEVSPVIMATAAFALTKEGVTVVMNVIDLTKVPQDLLATIQTCIDSHKAGEACEKPEALDSVLYSEIIRQPFDRSVEGLSYGAAGAIGFVMESNSGSAGMCLGVGAAVTDGSNFGAAGFAGACAAANINGDSGATGAAWGAFWSEETGLVTDSGAF